ncbi:hypothetical protein E4T45_02301, partial [Aureobasidium sp. EXF-8846]
MAGGDEGPASPQPQRRPPLGHRHSSNSSHVSQSPSDSTTKGHHKPHKSQRHVVSHHNRMGSRNPSFHRTLSKVKIAQHDHRQHDDDDPPPTPKQKQQASVASQSTLVPPSPIRPNMKRNNTSVHLPRNHSHAALKKNLSSGQLSRVTAGKTTVHARTAAQHSRPDIRRAHTGPVKRSKSPAPKPARQSFDVGDDDDDDDDDDDVEEMEGVEDQWTEESASASPSTTRDNTQANTRQNSVVLDPKLNPYARHLAEEEAANDSSGSDTVGSRSPPKSTKAPVNLSIRTKDFAAPQAAPTSAPLQQQLQHQQHQPPTSSYNAQAAQHHMPDADAIARRLLERHNSALHAAPPRVSSVSALANPHYGDPKSLSNTNAGSSVTGGSNTPLVSRFITNDGVDSKDGTPADQSGFLQGAKGHSRTASQAQTRKEQSDLYRNQSTPNFASQKQPPTPSGSGAVTPDPALNQSRTQQKLWLQRGLSNIEASSQPHLPGLLPTGRAQAMRTPHAGKQFEFVDKEWAVVRRFQNPIDAGL